MLIVRVTKSEQDLQQELIARHLVGLIKALGLREKVLTILHKEL